MNNMNNKDILFTFGTLAHTMMYINFSRFELNTKMEALFPLGHVMISAAMFLRTNERYRKKYLDKMSKLGMLGHTLLFVSTLLNAKFDENGTMILPSDEKVFLAGQVAMFALYYNEEHGDDSSLVRYEKYFAYVLMAGFYIYAAQFSENKKIFTPMMAIGILYVALLILSLNEDQ
jgi:hypothetical protein